MIAPLPAESLELLKRDFDALLVAPPLERRRLQCYLGLLIADMAALLISFGVAGYLYLGVRGASEALLLAQLLLPIFVTLALYNAAYSIKALLEPWRGIVRIEAALGISSAAFVFIAFYTKSGALFSRVSFTVGMLCAVFLLAWLRLQMRSFVSWRCGDHVTTQLVIRDGGPSVNLPGAIHVSAPLLRLFPDLNNPDALDRLGLVLRNVDRVVISCPGERKAAWAMMLKGANVAGEVLDDEVIRLGAQGARVAGDHGLLLVSAGPLGLRSRAIKRIFDLIIAASGLLLLSPLLLVVAFAIKLEDGGPVLFVQRRMGRGNRFFAMYKFRSMSIADQDGAVSTSRQDHRITRTGRFIRRTSIDELPQLLNVLLNDMSLVGPRPHALGSQAGDKHFWEVDIRYWQRHCLKPGLSGLAQIRGFRGATEEESDLLQRLQSDLEYVEGWTIFRDIKICVLTLGVLMHDRAF
jgi:lipopolysaccharide/colanic/teichoic acid biosynthesis glycosyltransferase